MTTKYRINWRVVKTGTTGQKERVFTTRKFAQSRADTLNAVWQGDIIHKVESVEVEKEQCDPAD